MRSYMKDCKHKTPAVNESNWQIYRAAFFFGGVGVFLMGAIFAALSTWAGLPLIIVGVGIMAFALIYFRRVKKG